MTTPDTSNDAGPEDFCGEVSSTHVEVYCSNLLCATKIQVHPNVLDSNTWVFCQRCQENIRKEAMHESP